MEKKIYKCYFNKEDDETCQLILCDSIEQAQNEDDFELVEEFKEESFYQYVDDSETETKEFFVKDLLEEFKDSKYPIYI